MTKHLRAEIAKFEGVKKKAGRGRRGKGDNVVTAPVCVNIVTDGEPNDRSKFENELLSLARKHQIFLTFNLCTDDDRIVDCECGGGGN